MLLWLFNLIVSIIEESTGFAEILRVSSTKKISCKSKSHKDFLQWGTPDAEIKSPSVVKNQELREAPFKAWAMHASPTVRDFFLDKFYLPGHFIFIFSKTSPEFSLCKLWLM